MPSEVGGRSSLRFQPSQSKDTSEARFSHTAGKTHAIFDDEHVISYGGPAPALLLAERAGLDRLVGEYVALTAAEGGTCQTW